MKKLLNKKGFTLIELIVVIAILAILALILVPSIIGYIARAQDATNEANARTAYTAAVLAVSLNPDITVAELEAEVLANVNGLVADDLTVTYSGGAVTVTYKGFTFPQTPPATTTTTTTGG